MKKIIVEEFDACHKFLESTDRFILPPKDRKFIQITHLVGCDELFVFVSYDKKEFDHRIKEFIGSIIKEAQKSDLYSYHRAVRRTLVKESYNGDWELFDTVLLLYLE